MTSVEREVREPKAGTEYASRSYVTGPGSAMIAEWDAANAISQGYYANVFVWACVRALAEDVAALTFRAGKTPDEPTNYSDDAPLAHLLGSPPKGPNRYTTGRQLIAWSIAQLLVTGRMGWELAYETKGRSKIVESLWPLAASHLEPTLSARPGRYFDGFVFNRASGKPVVLTEDQVFYHWRPSQHDWRQPESSLQAARLDVSVAVMQDRYDYAFIRNDARPATVVVHQAFSERGARAAFRAGFLGDHAGPDNAGRTAFVETSENGALPKESLLIEQIGLSQRDSMAIERYERKIRNIILAFGVPISRLGDSSEKTFANASVEYKVYVRDRVLPLAREVQDAINMQVAPRVGNELGWFDLGPVKAAITGDQLRAVGLPELLKVRAIKLNEARHALDLEPVEGGDRFLTDLELGLLQNGAATIVVPQTAESSAPYERGAEIEEVPEPVAPLPTDDPTTASAEPEAPTTPDPGRRTTSRTARETRRLRAYAAIDKRAKAREAEFEAAFQSILDAQVAGIVSRLTGKRGRQMLRVGGEGRQQALDASVIFDVRHWENATAAELQALYSAVAEDAVTHLTDTLAMNLDLKTEWARDFIESRSNQLAYDVTQTTYEAIQRELSEGVGAGESIPKLEKRIRDLFEQTYKNRARTVARTEVISAHNGATALAANASTDVVTLEWLATPGPRTRASHAAADGQRVPKGGTFSVGSAEMRYPGDPSAPAREVVNCRCTLLPLTAADLEG